MYWYSIKEYIGWFVLVFALSGIIYFGAQENEIGSITIAVGKDSEVNKEAAEAIKKYLQSETGITVNLNYTNGSLDSRSLLLEGQADFAIVMPSLLPDFKGVSAITPVADHYLHLLGKPGNTITSKADIAGKLIAVGSVDSDSNSVAVDLLKKLGVAVKDMEFSYKSVDSLIVDPAVEGAITLAKAGDFSVQQVLSKSEAVLTDFPGLEKLVFSESLLEKGLLPQGIYQQADKEAAAYSAIRMISVLVAHENTPAPVIAAVNDALNSDDGRFVLSGYLVNAGSPELSKSWQVLPKAISATSQKEAVWLGVFSTKEFALLCAVLCLIAGFYLWHRNQNLHRLRLIQAQQKQIVFWLQQLRTLEGEAVADRDPNHIQHFLEQLQLVKSKVEVALIEYEESNRNLLDIVLNESNALMNRLHMAKLSVQR
jgi:TRAP-type uncharacterized transport system substrate-binding protein